jgi:hypothetical protein
MLFKPYFVLLSLLKGGDKKKEKESGYRNFEAVSPCLSSPNPPSISV